MLIEITDLDKQLHNPLAGRQIQTRKQCPNQVQIGLVTFRYHIRIGSYRFYPLSLLHNFKPLMVSRYC